MLTRIDVVEPPYMAPYQIPAIMIRPVCGPYFSVKGSMRVIVAVGPNPGRIPMTVPIRTPTMQARRIPGVSAEANPLTKCSSPDKKLLSI
jgi:hypothetical protein